MRVFIFGQLRIEDDQGNNVDVTEIKSRKARELLLYFIIFHKRRIATELLCETFWPGMEEDYARSNLQTAVSLIRRFLGKEILSYSDGTYCFDENNKVIVDAEEFESSIVSARGCQNEEEKILKLKQILEGYTNDILPQYCYEEWIVNTREHYKDLFVDVLMELIAHSERCGNFAEVRDLSKRAMEKDPLNEQACLSHMKALAGLGQVAEALRFYESFSQRMEKELGILPCQQLRDLRDQLSACRKRKTWIVTIETNQVSEAMQILKSVLREDDEVRIISGQKIALFVKDVEREVAESIRKRIEEALDKGPAQVKTSLRLAR
ncbi:AfsR/SARP family transcriptional regulator [Pseudothermotoga sp.]